MRNDFLAVPPGIPLAVLCCALWLCAPSRVVANPSAPSFPGVPSVVLPDAHAVNLALDRAVRDVNAQTVMPEGGKMAATIRPEGNSGKSSAMSFHMAPRDIRGLARWLLWGSVAVMIAIALFHLRSNLWSFSRVRDVRAREESSAAREKSAASAARMERAGGEADSLAEEGDYAEAIHVLLLRTLEELRLRSGTGFAASLTSRELLRGLELPADQRRLFGEIIGRVEVSWFGPHEPDAEEYAACRRDFEILKDMIRAGDAA